MAHSYTDPKTGITRDQYGNEVARNETASTRHSSGSYWTWIVGIALAAILAAMLYNMAEPNNPVVTSPNDRSTTEPLNKAAPQTP
jgi:hypothetical protein